MGEHKIPREPAPEPFSLHDEATGKSFPIREATDEQLSRAAALAGAQHKQLAQQVMQLLGAATQAATAEAVFRYEMDRRQRSITLASPLDLANLRRQ